MNLKNNDQFIISVRQYENINQENSLVNIFPVLIDKSLKRYENVLRNFLIVSLISQIKVNNVLKLTSMGTSQNNTDYQFDNIAEKMHSSLGYSQGNDQRYSRIDLERDQFQSQRAEISRFEYQDNINKMLGFIKNQIQYDPQYQEFQPFISSITTEKLIQIPLIVGSKNFDIDTEVGYWILFVSLATSTPLDSNGNLERIKKFMRMIPKDDYMDLFAIKSDFRFPTYITNPDNSPLVNKFITNTNTKIDKVAGLFSNVLNEKNWNDEVGFDSASSLKISTSLTQTAASRQQILNKANTLISSFMSNSVIDKINSIMNSVIGQQDIDVPELIEHLVKQLNPKIAVFNEKIVSSLIAGLERTETSDEGENMLKVIKGNCEVIGKFGVADFYKNMQKANFRLMPNGSIAEALINFVEDFVRPVSQIEMFTGDIRQKLGDIGNFGNNNVTGIIDEFRQELYELYINFFYDRRLNIVTAVGQGNGARFNSPTNSRFAFITGNNNNQGDGVVKYLENMASALKSYTVFICLYTISSYFCEFLKEVEVNLEVQRKNASSFPNYTLIIPVEFIKGLYIAIASHSFKEMLAGNSDLDPKFTPSEKNINTMVNKISERIKIPNIIVVERNGTVYYRFKYMRNCVKSTLSTLENYVKHQSNVLSGF